MSHRETITEDEFLARCKTAYLYATPARLRLMRDWLDFVMRFEHTLFSVGGQTQGRYVWDFLENERERLGPQAMTLASDGEGYALQQIAAILSHPCQVCAEDPGAWHTRSGFCSHGHGIIARLATCAQHGQPREPREFGEGWIETEDGNVVKDGIDIVVFGEIRPLYADCAVRVRLTEVVE